MERGPPAKTGVTAKISVPVKEAPRRALRPPGAGARRGNYMDGGAETASFPRRLMEKPLAGAVQGNSGQADDAAGQGRFSAGRPAVPDNPWKAGGGPRRNASRACGGLPAGETILFLQRQNFFMAVLCAECLHKTRSNAGFEKIMRTMFPYIVVSKDQTNSCLSGRSIVFFLAIRY
jgi:hypothetical protein